MMAAKQHGLLAHTTLALTPERVPLGLIAHEIWARDPATSSLKTVSTYLTQTAM